MSSEKRSSLPDEMWTDAGGVSPDDRARMARVWTLAGEIPPEPVSAPDDDAAWADLEGRLAAPGLNGARRPDRPAARVRRRWGVMTGVAAVLLAVAGLFLWRVPVDVVAPRGQQVAVTLPDGSRVELNSGTTLRYTRGFADFPLIASAERRVAIEGEAYFQVVSDGRPFVVATFNAETHVLGTAFNVRAWNEGARAETRVTLAEGRVEVRPSSAPEAAVMLEAPGDAARVADRAERVAAGGEAAAMLDHVLSWRQRGFVFVEEPLGAIIAELERRFGLDVQVDGALPMDERWSVLIARDASPERILNDLCIAIDCQFRTSTTGYVLYRAD